MVDTDLGANEFTFNGDRTQIAYLTQAPGPVHPGQEGGIVTYQGIEGDRTFKGKEISLEATPLGTLLTVPLRLNVDSGGLTVTVLIPQVLDVTRGKPVTFTTMAIKATSRGNFVSPGAALTYTIIPLVATASIVIMPAAQEGAAG